MTLYQRSFQLQTTQLITKYFIHTAAPSLPSLPLPKPAYAVPPPAPQVFIIKENNESPKDQEDSKSAEALDNLSKTFEDAFTEAYKSEERKGRYRHQPRNGRFRQRLQEQDTFDNDSDEPPRNGFRHRLHDQDDPSLDLEQEVIKDIEKEEGEERMQSSVGSRREIARHNSTNNSEDDEDYNSNNDDDLSDNGDDRGDTNGYDDRGHGDNHKANEDDDSEDNDDDDDDDSRHNYDDRNDDDDRANMDIDLNTEPSSDADEPRHSHSHPDKKYNDYRQGDIKRRRIRKKKKYTRYHDYRRGNHPKESQERDRLSLAKSNSIRKYLKVPTHTNWANHKAEAHKPPKKYSYAEKQKKNPRKTTLRSKKYRKSKKTKVKSLKHRLKSQYYPNRNSVRVRYNKSKFAHLQERDSGKSRHHHHTGYPAHYHKQLNHHQNGHRHGKQYKQRGTQYKKHQNHHNQQYKNSYSNSGSLLPENEISESSTFEEGSANQDHESSTSSGSEDPNSPSDYTEGDRHVSAIKSDVNKGLKTLLSTVQSFKLSAHHKLRKNTNWGNVAEKDINDYNSGEESGENEVSGFEGSHYN